MRRWQARHFSVLRQYWHTESEVQTAQRLGVSRGACYNAAMRLEFVDAEFHRLCQERQEDYKFLIVGEQRVQQGLFRGWTPEQVQILWDHWHLEADAECARRIGKATKACRAIAARLCQRDPEFARLITTRDPEYAVEVAQRRVHNMRAARWGGHQKRERVAKPPAPPRKGLHKFQERFLGREYLQRNVDKKAMDGII